MSKTLIIAEKPSVAQDIVRALTPLAGKFDKHDKYFESDTYVVTSAVGHLVEIKAPEEFDVKRGRLLKLHLPRFTSNSSGALISTRWPTALVTT